MAVFTYFRINFR